MAMAGGEDVEALRSQIQALEAELVVLKRRLDDAENVLGVSPTVPPINPSTLVSPIDASNSPVEVFAAAEKNDHDWTWPLDVDEYKRYGRQMIMPEIGLKGCSSPTSPRLSCGIMSLIAPS